MLDPGALAVDGLVACLRPLAELAARLGLSCDAVLPAVACQDLAVGLVVVAAVGIQPRRGVGAVEHRRQRVAVVHVGRRHLPASDELPAHVHVGVQLVAVEALLVLLRPARVAVLVGGFLRAPVLGRLALVDLRLLVLGQVLDRRAHQGGVDDLPAARDVAVSLQLLLHGVEDGPCAESALRQALLEQPDRAGVREAKFIGQAAKALEAAPVEQLVLGLLIGQVVQRLHEQHPHHRLGWVRRAPAFAAVWARAGTVHRCAHLREVHQLGHALQAARVLL